MIYRLVLVFALALSATATVNPESRASPLSDCAELANIIALYNLGTVQTERSKSNGGASDTAYTPHVGTSHPSLRISQPDPSKSKLGK